MYKKLLLWLLALAGLTIPMIMKVYFHYPPETYNILHLSTLAMLFLYPSWIVLLVMLCLTGSIIYLVEYFFYSYNDIKPIHFTVANIFSNGFLLVFFAYYRIKSFKTMEELKELSIRDPMTKLFNRRYLKEKVENYDLTSTVSVFSMIVCDIDHFKSINDRYGHFVGDRVIQEIAKILKNHTNPENVLFRLGGEEFMVYLPETGRDEAYYIAENIRKVVEQHTILINNQSIKITISLGVAVYTGTESAQEMMNQADNMLYKAKKAGRNQTCM